jgi:hypothetical protein
MKIEKVLLGSDCVSIVSEFNNTLYNVRVTRKKTDILN